MNKMAAPMVFGISRRLSVYYSPKVKVCVPLSGRYWYSSVGNQIHPSPVSVELSKSMNYVEDDSEKIIIPQKIHRSSTALLEALQSTIRKDPLAPHFKYVDDPFLIPYSSAQKRTYALSKASGIKAAKYIIKTYPQYIPKNEAEPNIECFSIKSDVDQIKEALKGEEALISLIDGMHVTDAWEYYNQIKSEGSTISEETSLKLLDLLCAYNSEAPPVEAIPDEQWYWKESGQDNSRKLKKTWKDGSAAEQLFEELQDKSVAAYQSIVRGLCKYLNVDKAYDLYNEMIANEIVPDCTTFNSILGIAPFLRDENEMRWDLVNKILEDMRTCGVPPNLSTFNAVFFALSRMSRWKNTNQLVFQTLNEMKACNIEPSLGTWHYVLQIFYRNDGAQNAMLYAVMDHLDGKEFYVRHASDLEFFKIAMIKCCVNLKDIDLAQQIDKLVNTGNNVALIGDGYKETTYYSFYFRLLCELDIIENIMETYERICPNVWTPGFNIMNELIQALTLQDGFKYLPQIWSDLILFNYLRRDDIVEPTLGLMAKLKDDAKLQEIFHNVAKQVLKLVREVEASAEDRFPIRNSITLTGAIISNLIEICLNSQDAETSWEFFEMYEKKKESSNLSGLPSESSLKRLCEEYIKSGNTPKAIKTVAIMADLAYPSNKTLIKRCEDELELNESERSHLSVLS